MNSTDYKQGLYDLGYDKQETKQIMDQRSYDREEAAAMSDNSDWHDYDDGDDE